MGEFSPQLLTKQMLQRWQEEVETCILWVCGFWYLDWLRRADLSETWHWLKQIWFLVKANICPNGHPAMPCALGCRLASWKPGDKWALRHWHLVELQPKEQLCFIFIKHAETPMTELAWWLWIIITLLQEGLHPFLWGWVRLIWGFFAGLLFVTSAAFIWFQVMVLCSFVSSSSMLLLRSSELDLSIRIPEYFF